MSKDKLNIDNLGDQLADKEDGLYEEVQSETPPVTTTVETEQVPTKQRTTFEPDNSGLIRGWTKINKEIIPTEGMFSDPEIEVHGRPAKTKDIRYFTPVVEDDSYTTDEKINYILSECLKVNHPSKRMSYKDLLDIDKIFYMLSIRDMTFYKIPNPLKNITTCTNKSCEEPISLEVYSNNSTFFEMSDILKKFYDPNERCFIIEMDDDSKVELSPPTIGRSETIKSYIAYKKSKGISIDNESLQLIKYIHIDWKDLDNQSIDLLITKSQGWSIELYSAVVQVIREIKKSISMKSHGICGTCGAEVSVPFRFQGGFRDFFIIPDILK